MSMNVYLTGKDSDGTNLTDNRGRPTGNTIVPDGVKLTSGQQGNLLYAPLIGTLTTYAALPSGSGKGADTYVVDLSLFGASNIYLVALYTTGTVFQFFYSDTK